jgi:hypothetical protein
LVEEVLTSIGYARKQLNTKSGKEEERTTPTDEPPFRVLDIPAHAQRYQRTNTWPGFALNSP